MAPDDEHGCKGQTVVVVALLFCCCFSGGGVVVVLWRLTMSTGVSVLDTPFII